MRPADALHLVLKQIRARLLESLLVVVGVALGVGVISSTLSLSRLMKNTTGGGRSVGMIMVHPSRAGRSRSGRGAAPASPSMFRWRASGRAPSAGAGLSFDDIEAAKAAAPDVPWGFFVLPFSESKSKTDVDEAVTGDYFSAFALTVASGALFTATEDADALRVAVLGAKKAELLFPSGEAVGSTVTVFGIDYQVVGVLEPAIAREEYGGFPPDLVTFVPLRSSPVFAKVRNPPELIFMAAGAETVRAASAELRAWFDSRYGAGAITVESRVEAADRQQGVVRGVVAVLLVSGAGLLIASINMLNVLLARVARRVRGTGISVALGAPPRSGVFGLNVAESLVLGLAGCVLGVPFAAGFNVLLAQLFSNGSPDDQRLLLTPATVLAAGGIALGINAVLAAWPAWRAARMSATDAIRGE